MSDYEPYDEEPVNAYLVVGWLASVSPALPHDAPALEALATRLREVRPTCELLLPGQRGLDCDTLVWGKVVKWASATDGEGPRGVSLSKLTNTLEVTPPLSSQELEAAHEALAQVSDALFPPGPALWLTGSGPRSVATLFYGKNGDAWPAEEHEGHTRYAVQDRSQYAVPGGYVWGVRIADAHYGEARPLTLDALLTAKAQARPLKRPRLILCGSYG